MELISYYLFSSLGKEHVDTIRVWSRDLVIALNHGSSARSWLDPGWTVTVDLTNVNRLHHNVTRPLCVESALELYSMIKFNILNQIFSD